MLKVKVLKRYRDKDTLVLRRKNQELEITDGRFTEINGTPAGVLVEEIKKKVRK
jgi:hypothetical protein